MPAGRAPLAATATVLPPNAECWWNQIRSRPISRNGCGFQAVRVETEDWNQFGLQLKVCPGTGANAPSALTADPGAVPQICDCAEELNQLKTWPPTTEVRHCGFQ